MKTAVSIHWLLLVSFLLVGALVVDHRPSYWLGASIVLAWALSVLAMLKRALENSTTEDR